MKLKGTAHKLDRDGINTDYIISGRYKFHIQNMKELGRHIFEDLEPDFAGKIKPGDFIVARRNFGCGSSREQAPLALKAAGIKAVIARSFGRIFYRNAFNVGLLLIEADTSFIKDKDRLELDLEKGILRNASQRKEITIKPLPDFMRKIIASGGVLNYLKKYGGFRF